MKKLFFSFLFVCSFAVLSVSCNQEDDSISSIKTEKETSEMRYTSCPAVNSTADYINTDFPINWRDYVMGSNKLLRIKKSMIFDNTKPMSVQVYTNSGSAKARMFIKNGTNIIAFSACSTVTSSVSTIVSSTNVPSGTTEFWLEFYSDTGVTVNYYRMAQ